MSSSHGIWDDGVTMGRRVVSHNCFLQHAYVTSRYFECSVAAYLVNSLGSACMADLPYTEASNQQSYQQLLWKTRAFVGAAAGAFSFL